MNLNVKTKIIMKKLLFLQFCLFYFLTNGQNPPTVFFAGGNICETTPFKLVFFDEFNGNELSAEKWINYFPDGPNGSDQCSFCRTHSKPDKQEGQIYRDENIRVMNGILYLDVKEQAGTWYEFNKKYTSGMIYSLQSFNTYTKYEVRCKISSGIGYWPAFWAFGWGTELDIFEFYEESDRYECSVHNWNNNDEQFHQIVDPALDMSQDFHTYAVEYDKFFVNFYLDGIKKVTMPRYFKLDGSPVTNCIVPAGTYIQHPEFPKLGNPLNIIANVALFDEPADQLAIIPKSMEIDYIRVYQRSPQSGLSDLCNSFQINGSSTICNFKDSKDTVEYCFDGPINNSSHFTTSNNIEIVQNPSYEITKIDTSILVNGVNIDTFYYDTTYHLGCVKITPKLNAQDEVGSITLTSENEPCGLKTFNLPIQIGTPTPIINVRINDPCSGFLVLKTPNHKIDLLDFEIYNKGNLISDPIITDVLSDGVYINLPEQRIFENSFFYIKITVTSKCGEREIITKVMIPNSRCRNIEYAVSPNPTNGLVSLELLDLDMIYDISKFYVKNAVSSEIVYFKENIVSISDLKNIDISHLPNGTYITLVENNEFQLFPVTFQLIK